MSNITATTTEGALDVRGHYLTPVVITLMVLMSLTVFMRLFTRIHLLHSFGLDDWLIIPALLAAYGTNIAAIISERVGWGRHIDTLSDKQWTATHKIMVIIQITMTFSVALTKLSILLFYRRFCITKPVRLAINIAFGYIVLWLIGFFFLILFQCRPLSAYWGSLQGQAQMCIFSIQVPLYLGHGLGNLFGDVVVLAIPIPTIIRLQLPWRQKVGLLCLFSLGSVVCAATLMRIVSLYQVSASPIHDVSWYGYDLWVYTNVETNIGVICASIPSVKPLLVRFFPKLASWSARGTDDNSTFNRLGDSRDYPTVGNKKILHTHPSQGTLVEREHELVIVERNKPFRSTDPEARINQF